MDVLRDLFLIMGRASLGAVIGGAIGWATQGEQHSRWFVAWLLLGYLGGAAAMWPNVGAIVGAVFLLIPAAAGTIAGFYVGIATLKEREDWYLRSWGLIGFLAFFHVFALVGLAIARAVD